MAEQTLGEALAEFQAQRTNLFQKDFLISWEHPLEEIEAILALCGLLKRMHREGLSYRAFDAGLAISIFRDNSTRTRFSFASAASALGLSLADLDEEKSQIAHGETVRETANMVSFLCEVIGIRDDIFLGEGNRYMREFGSALTDGARQGVLHRRPSIVNLQCDVDHPTQALADLAWLKQHFGGLENLRGKKIAMTWAYSPSYGKPLSVPQGVIGLMSRFGMQVSLAHPEGYGLIPEVIEVARKNALASGGKFEVVTSMEDAFRGADVVYPKSWAPFGVMQRRTELLMKSDKDALRALEKECLANNARFSSWECNRKKMDLTRQKSALYMHCLPADITDVSCKAGEVSAEVFEQYRIPTYHQASYKPFIISALMFLTRIRDPAAKVAEIEKRARALALSAPRLAQGSLPANPSILCGAMKASREGFLAREPGLRRGSGPATRGEPLSRSPAGGGGSRSFGPHSGDRARPPPRNEDRRARTRSGARGLLRPGKARTARSRCDRPSRSRASNRCSARAKPRRGSSSRSLSAIVPCERPSLAPPETALLLLRPSGPLARWHPRSGEGCSRRDTPAHPPILPTGRPLAHPPAVEAFLDLPP